MNRSAFIRRMAFAALATVFLDLPLPSEPEPQVITAQMILDTIRERGGLSQLGVMFPDSTDDFRRSVIDQARDLA